MSKMLSSGARQRRIFWASGLLTVLICTAANAGIDEAKQAFIDENYDVAILEADAAIETFSEKAQTGDPEAFDGLAWAYFWRHSANSALNNAPFDPTPSLCNAIKSWEQASARDNTQAQTQLATLYLLGKSMPESSPDRAYFWARIAIETSKKAQQGSVIEPEITLNMALAEIPRDRIAVIDTMVKNWIDAPLDKRLGQSDDVAQCPTIIE